MAAHLCFVPIIGSMWPDSEEAGGVSYSIVTMVPVPAPPLEDPEEEISEPRFVALPDPVLEEEPPIDARFADRFDRRVERETVADDLGERVQPMNAAAAARGLEHGTDARTVATALPSRTSGDREPVVNGEGDVGEPDTSEGSVLPTHIEAGADSSIGDGRADAASPEGEGLDLSAFHIDGRAALTIRQGARLDYLQLEESDRTLVNSARSMYWSFFMRMKLQVQGEWDPLGVYREEDPSGRLHRRQDRYTVLAVTLGSDGGLAEAAVERSCGLDFLDEEAVRAFRSAAPFPNVPEGLKDDEGFVDVRFGFLLSLGGVVHIERIPQR